MDIFKSTLMNTNGGYVNYQTSVRALLKLAALKAIIPVRSIIEFFAEQGQSFQKSTAGLSSVSKKRHKLPGKFSSPKMASSYNGIFHKERLGLVNIVDFESGKKIDISQNRTDMSPAQIVYAVIYNQQVEWTNDTEKVSR